MHTHSYKIAEGTAQELKRVVRNSETITIDILDIPKEVLDTLRQLSHVYELSYQDNKLIIRCCGGKHNLVKVLGVLQQHELSFGRVYTELPTLNDVFLEITGKALRDKED